MAVNMTSETSRAAWSARRDPLALAKPCILCERGGHLLHPIGPTGPQIIGLGKGFGIWWNGGGTGQSSIQRRLRLRPSKLPLRFATCSNASRCIRKKNQARRPASRHSRFEADLVSPIKQTAAGLVPA